MPLIKAAVCHEFGAPLKIEDVELRAPEGAEVEVTLDAVAICHSDISFASGGWGGSLPAVYGHEAAGRVTAVGDRVSGVSVGDSVVVTLIRACGSCPNCASGRPVICETPYDGDTGPLKTKDGGKLHQAMASGAFAEKVVVDQAQVVRISADIPKDAASLIACGVITGLGAHNPKGHGACTVIAATRARYMSFGSVFTTWPNTTCPTASPGTFARDSTSATTFAPRSVGEKSFRLPPKSPIAVRTPLTTTTSFAALLIVSLRFVRARRRGDALRYMFG